MLYASEGLTFGLRPNALGLRTWKQYMLNILVVKFFFVIYLCNWFNSSEIQGITYNQ